MFLSDLTVAFVRSQWQPVPGPATVITSSRRIRTFASIDGKGLVVRVLPSLEQHRPKHDQGDDKNDEDLKHLNLLRPDASYRTAYA